MNTPSVWSNPRENSDPNTTQTHSQTQTQIDETQATQ